MPMATGTGQCVRFWRADVAYWLREGLRDDEGGLEAVVGDAADPRQ